ncbi:MAG: hypothetical protein AB8C84_00505 [Oligoflexales bacterium]
MNIELKKIQTHNLKGFDLEIPLGEWTVVTGVSGSGKSSLVFHTLYAEAYRRYVESLSSYARQFLKALPKPSLKAVENLPPAIALRQQKARAGARSTVGTMTEIVVLLRSLFVQHGQTICDCGSLVNIDYPAKIAESFREKKEDLWVLAPLDEWELSPKELWSWLRQQGFARCFESGKRTKLESYEKTGVPQGVSLLITKVKPEQTYKIEEALSLAFRVGKRRVIVLCGDDRMEFYNEMRCNACHKKFRVPSVGLLSWNHPLGACQSCQGFGRVPVLDWEKVLPNRDLSLFEGAVAPLAFSNHDRWLTKFSGDLHKPLVQMGVAEEKQVKDFILKYFQWVDSKKYKSHYRIHSARYHQYETCSACRGYRLNEQALSVQCSGYHLGDLCQMQLSDVREWLGSVPKNGVEETHEEAMQMLDYLNEIGLSYLSIERKTESLSGGELQRLKMARSLGHELTEALYCLDEPTAGLHPLDVQSVIRVIQRLKSQGNTVVVVEHDKQVIQHADHFICLGPEAGHRGGQVVSRAKEVVFQQSSQNRLMTTVPLSFQSGRLHNLKNQCVTLQAQALNLICGVSGSGKSTMIRKVLVPQVLDMIAGNTQHRLLDKQWECFEHVLVVDQEPPGKSRRSNIATYLGVMDELRKAFAKEPLAQQLGLKLGSFSFNVPGGRCEVCQGVGEIEEEVSFLGAVQQVCPDCEGQRFDEKVLSVRWRSKNLSQVLSLTVEEALEHFHDQKKIAKILTQVVEAGLGYLTLGQSTNTFSGGESQRLKLLHELVRVKKEKPHLIVLDEPTVGLSDQDVLKLLENLNIVIEAGHTVIVIEHHIGLLKAADWVIEMGPGAGDQGGKVTYQGSMEGLREDSQSNTARFL